MSALGKPPGRRPERKRLPQADEIMVCGLIGRAWARARWRKLAAAEQSAAAAELRELADGRTDLLAAAAGLHEGIGEGGPGEAASLRAAGLCRKAGADPGLIPEWTAEGRRRAARDRAALERGDRRFAARVASIARQLPGDHPQTDRDHAAQLAEEAARHVKWGDVTEAEEDAAIIALRALAGGRADLLTEVGRLFRSAYGCSDEHLGWCAAQLCYKVSYHLEWQRRLDAERREE